MEGRFTKSTWFFNMALLFLFTGQNHMLFARSQLLSFADDLENHTSQIRTYVVHVEDPAGSPELLGDEDFESWHRSFLPNSSLDTGEPRLIYSYRHVIGGFAARLSYDEVKAMESMEGFLYAWPEGTLTAQTTRSPEFLGLNEWQGLWYTSGFGSGMIIGVLDTGIEPSHPSFSDDGMAQPPLKWRGSCAFAQNVCNNKLIGAVAFQGQKSPSPQDDNGHGTHVASTAAGSPVYNAGLLGQARGRAVGMAPKAHLAMYRVLYNFYGQDSDFLAAINRGIQDGVDVLSMSLGSTRPVPLSQSAISRGSFGAIMNGIFPSACAMNEGPTPSIISNDAPWVLTVGASSMDRRIKVTVKLGNNVELDGESAYQPKPYNSPQLLMEFPGMSGIQGAMTCENGSLDTLSLQGKLVVCVAGGKSGNTDKGQVVGAAGGAAMIVMNDVNNGYTTFSDPHTLPAAHVSYADAWKVISYMKTSPFPTGKLEFKGTQFGYSPSPSVAFFSGRGPSLMNGGIIKPDIVGPGVNILAAWPWAVAPNPFGNSTFNFDSGTSMATPHLSGIAADLKKNHPNWSVAAIKSAIMTTAYTEDQSGNRILDDATGRPATFFVMGSGHVHPERANDPGLIYDMQPVDYIPYLCYMYPSRVVASFIRQRIDCNMVPKASPEHLNYPSIAVTLGSGASKVIMRTVTNVGGAERYSVSISAPNGVRVVADTNSLGFTAPDEKKSFRLQFTDLGTAAKGQVSEGSLVLDSGKHLVWSPISVTFT